MGIEDSKRRRSLDMTIVYNCGQHFKQSWLFPDGSGGGGGGGFCWSLMLVLLSLVLFSVGTAVSTLWVYTGGRLDQASIERALPVIQRDAEALAAKASTWLDAFNRDTLAPAWATCQAKLQWLAGELDRRHKLVAYWLNENMGPTLCYAKKQAVAAWEHARIHLGEFYEKAAKPFLKELQVSAAKYAQVLRVYLVHFMETAYHHATHLYNHLQSTFNNLVK